VRQARPAIRKARRDNPAQIIVTGCAAQTEARSFGDMPKSTSSSAMPTS
jgi:threonylcarbamoyladenosine tRNA methylthiotransferase MtaB